MAAVLPELEALDDVVLIEEWSSELWACNTVPIIEFPPLAHDDDDDGFTKYAEEYLSACCADDEEEDHSEDLDWAPKIKRKAVEMSTPIRSTVKSVGIQASAWSIDEAVRQSESKDRLRLFARMCNAEARITELEHEIVALTNHTNLRFTQVYSGKCYQEKWRSDTVADVLARAKKINFVPVLPKIETFTTDCDF